MQATPTSVEVPPPRLRLFLALSRTPHGVLDLATPAVAALLCLGEFPPLRVIGLGLLTAFAGYTAVYALNDLVDYRRDREKVRRGGFRDSQGYLDAVWVRHPMAQGFLSYGAGLLWALGWGALALFGAYLLNPTCAAILLAACALEAVYCRLQRISDLRVLLSGVVKTLGGIAAAYAVEPAPAPLFLVTFFLWIFFWEVGGQNVPHDWHDIAEDSLDRAVTIPVRYGSRTASLISFGSLTISVALCLVLLGTAPIQSSGLLLVVCLLLGLHYLIIPGYRLYRDPDRPQASALFNRASYYPLAILCAVAIRLALG